MGNIVLSVKNVTKRFGKRVAVNNLSFNVFRGEVFGLLGANGAGKSTTLKMIVGLVKIDEGDIFICDNSIKKNFTKAIVNVGGIIENPEMYSYLSGLANLRYYASLYKGITEDRIMEVVKLVGLTERIKDKVHTYSLGMKQRLGIAQALLHHPQLLILDEPTNGLDPQTIVELRKFLRNLAKTKKIAILISSHNLGEVSLLCDTVAIIKEGVLEVLKDLTKLNSKDRLHQVVLKVNFPNYAGKLIMQNFNIDKISIIKNSLKFGVNEEIVPKITKMLVTNGIEIYSIASEDCTLESVFLSAINKKSASMPKGAI